MLSKILYSMKYIIDISLAEDSKVVKTIGSTYYMSNGKCDTVTFSARSISIEAERGKAYKEDDIFNNVQNSLYNQMLKALLYHYAVNGAKAAVTRIEVTVVTAGRQSLLAARDFAADDQPLPVAAPLMALDSASLELLMDETGAAYDLRLTMVHWLSAMGESNKMTRLECLWRAYERICIYRRHRNRNELPYVSKALHEMEAEIKGGNLTCPQAIAMASRMTYDELRKLMWHDLIMGTYKNQYDLTIPRQRSIFKEKYVDYFLKYYDDARVVKLLLDTIVYMQAELTAIGEYNNIMTCLQGKLAANVRCDSDVLSLMTCRYAYFLRNRLFHGHSLLKCPIFNRQADMMGVGVTVSTVETLVAEMINNFGRL